MPCRPCILFLDGTLDANDRTGGLALPAVEVLHVAWAEHGARIDARSDLRVWVRLKYFKDVHKGLSEHCLIHWPLSSAKRTFVAWVSIHRWDARTLRLLLADHLYPAAKRIDGELDDLRAARDGADHRAAAAAERRLPHRALASRAGRRHQRGPAPSPQAADSADRVDPAGGWSLVPVPLRLLATGAGPD